jgi:hypothetical protein
VVATNIQKSGQHRPARYGGPFERADAAQKRAGMSIDEIGRIAVRAIADDDFLVITHPAGRSLLDAVQHEASAAHDRWEAILPGLDVDPAQSPL